jgi:CheY-like chemotaxis protein
MAQTGGDPFELLIAGLDALDRDGRPIAAMLARHAAAAPLTQVAIVPLRHAKSETAAESAAAYLTKPLTPMRLLNALGRAWASREASATRLSARRPAVAGGAAAGASSPPASEGEAAMAPLVLIAEDNFPNQRVAMLLLKRLGVRMDLAENGAVALEHLMARPYDLVLMDCHMPELNGYEAAAHVRRGNGPNRDVPIVAVTADVAAGSRERALDAGMNDFIGKPIHVSELERVLRTWIRPERRSPALVDAG